MLLLLDSRQFDSKQSYYCDVLREDMPCNAAAMAIAIRKISPRGSRGIRAIGFLWYHVSDGFG